MSAKRVKMTGDDGREEYWTFERVECVWLRAGHKPRTVAGWYKSISAAKAAIAKRGAK